jgi:arsenite methyltransferase
MYKGGANIFDGLRARMFNSRAANKGSQPDKVLSELALKEGEKVAEIGSGGGYFALRFASLVGPSGKVFCVDVNQNFLKFVADSAKKAGLSNVETVEASAMYDRLPKGNIDAVFLRSVYHHLEDRTGYFKRVASLLSPSGRVAIIDFLPEASIFFGPPPGHRTAPPTIIEEMQKAGYEVLAKHDFLATQSYIIFRLKK